MSYRLSTPVKPLVWVEAAVEHHKGSRIEYMVKVKAQFKRRSTANNVEIYVPVPDDADTPKFRVRSLCSCAACSYSGSNSPPPTLRHQRAVCSTSRTSPHLFGRSSNWEVVASSSCAHTSVSQAFVVVRLH